MVAEVTNGQERTTLEDPLSYFPVSAIAEYRKGDVIYDAGEPSRHLYLVLEGCVKVSRPAGSTEVVMNLCQADDFFGEPAFVEAGGERAAAIEPTKLMSWPVENVYDIISRHPRLGVALIQWLARRSIHLGERIVTLSADSTARRLAKALLDLADRLGHPDAQGPDARRIAPFSHKLLAQYIGTTREAVTHCLNQFRRQGFVSYSRRDMIIFGDPMRHWLEEEPSIHRQPPHTEDPETPEDPEHHPSDTL